MKYELAKQLKDAGFSMEHDFSIFGGLAVPDSCKCGKSRGTDEFHTPTLEELIEACGNEFQSLSKEGIEGQKEYWLAVAADKNNDYTDGRDYEIDIAVAKLWLKLNEKKKER